MSHATVSSLTYTNFHWRGLEVTGLPDWKHAGNHTMPVTSLARKETYQWIYFAGLSGMFLHSRHCIMQMRLLDVLHALERTTIKFKFSLCSKRFRASSSRTLGREQKKKEWRGRGRKKETLFPVLPSSPPLSPFFFSCSRSNFRAITRSETLATQANLSLILLFLCFFLFPILLILFSYFFTLVKGAVSRNSAKLGSYKMPIKLRET